MESERLVPRKQNHQKSIDSQHQEMKSSRVYVKDKTHGWLPGVLVDTDQSKNIATVICNHPEKKEVKVKLEHYGPSKSLPLQCVRDDGTTVVVEDMRDLPYSNEASILYNLKERYEQQKTPYTRATNNVMVAINPYEWVDGLYAEKTRKEYADKIVWKGTNILKSLVNSTSIKKLEMSSNFIRIFST